MTIKDLWDKFLTIDLIPIFEGLTFLFGVGLIVLVIMLCGAFWWSHRKSE